jgi:high-affinity iron transporter
LFASSHCAFSNILQFGNPELNGGGGWGIFNAILGWQNSATYGSVISYNVYWIVVIAGFVIMRYKETKGHLPFMKARAQEEVKPISVETSPGSSGIFEEAKEPEHTVQAVTTIPVRTLSE